MVSQLPVGRLFLGVISIALVACSTGATPVMDASTTDDAGVYDPHPVLPSWVEAAHVFVSGHQKEDEWDCRTKICRHNENVDMLTWNGAMWLVHRTARSQTLGPNSSFHLYKSVDGAKTWKDVATIQAPMDRDLRDPSLFVFGNKLYVKGITRLGVPSDRDSNVDSISVETHSVDGITWSPFTNLAASTWSFWRVLEHAGTYYSAAYEDGDKSVVLYSSTDPSNGQPWTKGAAIYTISADTPLETEIAFMPSGKMLALVRTDGTDEELLGYSGRLRTQVCWAMPPYATFTCPQTFDGQRLDGPVAFFWNQRLFMVARKHIQDASGRKRTSLFEITGTLEGGPLGIEEWGEIPSAGDTAYAGYAMLDANRVVVSWYSGDLFTDKPWLLGVFDLSDIWMATIDLSKLK